MPNSNPEQPSDDSPAAQPEAEATPPLEQHEIEEPSEVPDVAEPVLLDSEIELDADDFILRLYEMEKRSLQSGATLETSRIEYEHKQRAQWLKEAIDLHALRQTYTGHLFKLTCFWLTCVVLFVFLTGSRGIFFLGPASIPLASLNLTAEECESCLRFYFKLTDNVLIAFITSTTASVIGIFIIVAKWLFPSPAKATQEGEAPKKEKAQPSS